MTKLIKIICAGIFTITIALSGSVNIGDAVIVAENILQESKGLDETDYIFSDYQIFQKNDINLIFVIKFQPTGFVLVAADDRIKPVLGYSFESSFSENNLPPQFEYILQKYQEQIEFAIEQNIPAAQQTRADWDYYLSNNLVRNRLLSEVAPLITANWNQNSPWNEDCPEDDDGPGGYTFVGCVAVSMAQIMHYWNYPETGMNSHSYEMPEYGLISANFGETTYNYEAMQNNYSTSATQQLLFHCGVSAEMEYGPEFSSAAIVSTYNRSAITGFTVNFRYDSDLHYEEKSNYSDSNWDNLIKSELENGRPVIYRGAGLEGGHGWNVDGYMGSNYFHCNWGWGGAYNGYFFLNDLSPYDYFFNDEQGALIGIKPIGDLYGCTDPNALNYSPYATHEDGSCEHIESPLNLTATVVNEAVYLSWDSPFDVGNWPHCTDDTSKFADCSGTCFDNSDCAGNGYDGCVSGDSTWVGDLYCDDGTYGLNFTCSDYLWDFGVFDVNYSDFVIDPFFVIAGECIENTNSVTIFWESGNLATGLRYGLQNVDEYYLDLTGSNLNYGFDLYGFDPDQDLFFQIESGDLVSRVVQANSGLTDCMEGGTYSSNRRINSEFTQIQIDSELSSGLIRQSQREDGLDNLRHVVLAGFNVYRSVLFSYDYTLIASISAEDTSYIDENFLYGHQNYYVVTTVLNEENESSYSNEVIDPFGCTDTAAGNFDPLATIPDGSCLYAPDEIWPGDTNFDGLVNANDILPIGIYFRKFGNQRAGSEFEWQSNPIPENWVPIGAAFADANGDGEVNIADVLVILLNWGLEHSIEGSFVDFSNDHNLELYHDNFKEIYSSINGSSEAARQIKNLLEELFDFQPLPDQYILFQNYPNPFNPITNIKYQIPKVGDVKIQVFDITGKIIDEYFYSNQSAGIYEIEWNGNDQSSGLYFYRLLTDSGLIKQQKMLLLK